jgi:hypothetical protein
MPTSTASTTRQHTNWAQHAMKHTASYRATAACRCLQKKVAVKCATCEGNKRVVCDICRGAPAGAQQEASVLHSGHTAMTHTEG